MIVLLMMFVIGLSAGMFWLWPTVWIAGAVLSAGCVFALLCQRLRRHDDLSMKNRLFNVIYVPIVSLAIGAVWPGIPFLILPDRSGERQFARRKDNREVDH